MSKIICDICGTTYPDTAECCPICGCSNAGEEALLGAETSYDDILDEIDVTPVNTRKKEIFDFDEVNTEDDFGKEEEDDFDDEEDEESEPRHNTFVVILLTVLIVVLLGAAVFIYLRYFRPNMREEIPATTNAIITETEIDEPTTEPTVPCLQMGMLSASIAELNAEGQQFLLHIKAFPENTTDKIIYTSGDESIATVTEDGKITAISEGETVIYISCGKVSMDCPVIVKYVEETVPPTTEVVVEETVFEDNNEITAETEDSVTDESADEDEEDATQETDTNTVSAESVNLKDVQLKLKKKDIQLGVYYQFQLELDCALSPEEVTWSSEHPHIAKVDEKGNVTAVKNGTTSIIAKYGEQEVQCIVRCIWF